MIRHLCLGLLTLAFITLPTSLFALNQEGGKCSCECLIGNPDNHTLTHIPCRFKDRNRCGDWFDPDRIPAEVCHTMSGKCYSDSGTEGNISCQWITTPSAPAPKTSDEIGAMSNQELNLLMDMLSER